MDPPAVLSDTPCPVMSAVRRSASGDSGARRGPANAAEVLMVDANDDGRLAGDILLRLEADEELIWARCTLGPEDYMKALA